MVLDQNIHVLMASAALQGHLNPMLKFAKCLISKGIHVTLATTDLARHRMLKHTTTADPTNPSIQFEFFSDGLDLDFNRDANSDIFIDALRTKASKNLSNLIAKLSQTTKFSCLILHQFVPWFISIAKENNLPCAVLWIQPCALYSIYYRFFNKLNEFAILQNKNQPLQLPGLPLLNFEDLPTFIHPNAYLCFQKLLSEFFSFLDDEQVDNIANALLMSGKAFLWVFKRPSPKQSTEGCTVRLPDGFLEAAGERGLVVNWCSQEEMGVRMRKGDKGVASSKEVERCIWEMTDGPTAKVMAKRAVELMEAAKRAVEDGGSSHRNLDVFIADIGCKKVTT
ncbi:UDP-glycosyltransferase 84B2, partial [Cucurbita argyrosperma subsp. sororia]